MLIELTVEDFAIIDKLHLTFTSGFNVLTGETGAGKSIIIDAMSLLLGGRATSDLVRAGKKKAFVEGLFRLSPTLQSKVTPILEREGLDENQPDLLLLGREIRNAGRSFCRVNGRTVSLNLLEEVAAPLIDIHGQHHHLSLLQVKMHQAFLDRFGNLGPLRDQVATAYHNLQKVRQELRTLQKNAQQIARRVDQLTFQVEEIEIANLKPDEEETLTVERTRLSNAEKLNLLSSSVYQLLTDGDGEQPAITDLLGHAIRDLHNLQRIDDSVSQMVDLAEQASYQLEDLGGQLQTYGEEIEFNPIRLREVEERLILISSLKRKYGDSITEILTFKERAQAELDSISHSEERIEILTAEVETLRHSVGQLAEKLSTQRAEAGLKLAVGVEHELQALGMARTQFNVELERLPHPNGVYIGEETFTCDESGIDQVEFLIAPNPGEPLKPMIKIASGGETSRLMLALKTVLAIADETPTLIFDEIDQGIGGRVGAIVGEKLWGLTHDTRHQVLCITHLPQIAAFGDTHYHVAKQMETDHTRTRVDLMETDRRIDELAQMLGTLSENTRLSAQELLEHAAIAKGKDIPKQAALT